MKDMRLWRVRIINKRNLFIDEWYSDTKLALAVAMAWKKDGYNVAMMYTNPNK